ncbi:GH32 C-terminal domain-containing protein [Corynebacterium pseudotuberculosis]|uniref:GH32 C-terminal domain-containing protein n=1 Tax=Corynebacterium pseudotuberculosis TaxID=1719 RepID=UPI00090CC791|nr:GH32 C-terminal domain-containing protein [Corynebacterium pseudotuberculosis]APG81357.1 Sucrose-6-phosphate hydrolase [Corynebacterium pseudotuberculosis]
MAHRPELHVTPETGVLDAPAEALFDGQTWHVFHQFRPKLESGARWAHTVADETPFDWDICDDVLAPDNDEVRVRAGSVTSTDNTARLYFTSVSPSGDAIHLAEIAEIDSTVADISDDPSMIDPHVRRVGGVVNDQEGLSNFRSPCVVPNWATEDDREEGHKGWIMLAVTGNVESPTLAILDSRDGVDWSLRGPLKIVGDSGVEGERLVAPRIIRLRDEIDNNIYDVLIVTVETGGIDRSGYLVGTLSGRIFTVDSPFERLDYGHDFTRPRNTNYTAEALSDLDEHRYDTAYLFGLMNGIGRLDDPSKHLSFIEEKWANCLSFPRKMTLQGGKIYHTPVTGLPSAVKSSDYASMWTSIMDVPEGEEITITLHDSTGQVAASITHRGDLLELDRSMNPQHLGDDIAIAPLTEGDTDSMTIIVDGSTVEVFADGGQVAMASRVYFNGHCEEFAVVASKGASISHTDEIRPMKSVLFTDEDEEGPVR